MTRPAFAVVDGGIATHTAYCETYPAGEKKLSYVILLTTASRPGVPDSNNVVAGVVASLHAVAPDASNAVMKITRLSTCVP